MPDLRRAEQFIAAGERLEVRFVEAALASWRDARPTLMAALSVGQSVQPIVALVGGEVASAGDQLVSAAAGLAERYLADQLLAAGESPAQAGALLDGTAFAPLRSGLPAWQAATVGRFLSDVGQLAGDTPAAIAAALTASAGTPSASSFVWGLNALQLASEAAVWQSFNGALGRAYRELGRSGRQRFQKQAFAAIDKRTTECCLNVHGQIVDLDQPFTTSGRPAFAGEQMQPPFHHRCRTVIALYHPAMERVGPTTDELLAAAQAELGRR